MSLTETLAATLQAELRHLGALAFSAGSVYSVWSLASALVICVAIAVLGRRRGRRTPHLRVWLRALFPKRIVRSASTRADVGFFLLNTMATGALIGWAVLLGAQVATVVQTWLTGAFGAAAATDPASPLIRVVATAILFLAYEVAYWLEHYTSHKIPFFWAFHKVHHTAEVLTPLTVFRVHPVETWKFGNISALVIGATAGLLAWGFGGAPQAYVLNGTNLLLLVFIYSVVHLQHSHAWIATTGVWGRLFVSPAHHQIHHSGDPAHFDRNFGSTLAVWDWLAGTLHVPHARRERIAFGAGGASHRPHSVTGTLITPFAEAAATLRPKTRPS